MNESFVGIDVGTTVVKAAAFDAGTGRPLAQATRRLKVTVGNQGEREQSVVALDRAVSGVVRGLAERMGRRWATVAGIGLAAQGGSTIIVDRESGRPLTTMMLWNDTRAFGYLEQITGTTTRGFWRRRTLRDEPGMGLTRMLWLRDRHPELLAPENLYVGAGEYCYFRLTGRWFQDAGSALQVGCYNAPKKRVDQRLLDVVGVPASFVAPMREGHATHPITPGAARRLHLPSGIPVAGPYMDHEAGYLSAVGVSDAPLQCSLGTAWVANFTLPGGMRWTSPSQLVAPSVIPGKEFLVIQPLLTGNLVWDWSLAEFLDPNHERALVWAGRVFGQSLLPRSGVVVLPWFNRPDPFEGRRIGGGTFCGMNMQTTREDLVRSVASSLTYEMARVVGSVASRGTVDSVVLGGGASKGAFFCDLLASLFHPLAVYQSREQDLAGPRGTLYAFSRRVARARTRAVRKPAARLRDSVRRGFEKYNQVFAAVYGRDPIGRPVTFREKPS